MIKYGALSKAEVLAALYNHAKPIELGVIHYEPEDMTIEEAEELLKCHTDFDYVKGRSLKVDLVDDEEFEEGLYDREYGLGAAEFAMKDAIKTKDATMMYKKKHTNLMDLMDNSKDMRFKTVKKYGVLLGKITGTEELSGEMKIQLVDKLIKKAEKELAKIEKSIERGDKISDKLDYLDFAQYFGIAVASVGFVGSLLISGDMAQNISNYLMVSGVGVGIGAKGGQLAADLINDRIAKKHRVEEKTLKEVQIVLNNIKELLLEDASKFTEAKEEV